MVRTPTLLCVAGTMLVAGLHAAPAEAATAARTSTVVKNCSTTAHGVSLRVGMRSNLGSSGDRNYVRDLRVRVSHPDGSGKFAKSRVRSVKTNLVFESEWVNDQIGSAAWAERRGDRPVYTKRLRQEMGSITAIVTFRLKNGKRAAIACTQQFPKD